MQSGNKRDPKGGLSKFLQLATVPTAMLALLQQSRNLKSITFQSTANNDNESVQAC